MRKSTAISAVIRGIHNDWVYRQLEAAVDGIIDFKFEEVGEEARNLIRIRSLRDVSVDPKWRRVKIGKNSEVRFE